MFYKLSFWKRLSMASDAMGYLKTSSCNVKTLVCEWFSFFFCKKYSLLSLSVEKPKFESNFSKCLFTLYVHEVTFSLQITHIVILFFSITLYLSNYSVWWSGIYIVCFYFFSRQYSTRLQLKIFIFRIQKF